MAKILECHSNDKKNNMFLILENGRGAALFLDSYLQ